MKKIEDLTAEEKKKFLFEVDNAISRLENKRFRRKKRKMDLAEKELVATFDENQMALYNEFCKKRDIFYAQADEMYFNTFAEIPDIDLY